MNPNSNNYFINCVSIYKTRMSDDQKRKEITKTLRECEIPESIIGKVITLTTDPAEAFDLAFSLICEKDQTEKLLRDSEAKKAEQENKLKISEMKMVFLVRMDLKCEKKDFFSDIGSAGLIISDWMLPKSQNNRSSKN